MPRILFLLIFLALAAPAVDSLEQQFTCPICGTVWKERIETSARATGLRLDLRRLGDVVDPPTLPQCPKCGFVYFSDKLNERAVAKLKPFIQGQDYQLIAAKSPTYFCLAQIQQALKAPPRFVAQSYLRASWQVEDRPVIAARYLALAAEQFGRACHSMEPGDDAYVDTCLLYGETLRRIGHWPQADAHFRNLLGRPEFQEPKRQQIIAEELRLIAAKNAQPEQLREPGAPGGEPEMLPDPVPISVKKPVQSNPQQP
jgi:uncharacterized C2H2 Zn-finger protein